ncbi:MAG: PEP-CTERM sorting domain-containing protein [Acidobacteria bacterium]|nr:PEP-CTERM sorting domain-containing protein [Acidobacteriota bacterium]
MTAWRLHRHLGMAVLVSLFVSSVVQATVIVSPVAAPVNTLGEFGACCDIGNSIDGSGLTPGFVTGVTDFDAYLALNPLHDLGFQDQEFFGAQGVLSGTVVYDLGGVVFIDRMALWNEDSTGIAVMNVRSALDLPFTTGVVDHGLFNPVDNPINVDYPAEVLALNPTPARFVEMELRCVDTDFNNCGIGEVAFSATPQEAPEPASLVLLGIGILGLSLTRRRPH